MDLLDIGEVAARAGVKPSALRYYEEIGLIAAVSRRGLRRQYPAGVLLRLDLIALGKSAGFSLGDIARMFGTRNGLELPRAELRRKADDLDRQIRGLAALSDTLRHVADCRAPSHLECPTFRRLVELAGRRGRPRAGRYRARPR